MWFMENLNNKTIVVTGANGLIGENLVLNLINRKSKIIAIDKSFKEKEVANMFQEKYRYKDILLYSTDILDEKQLSDDINEGFKKFGSIDGLVNCAAIDSVPNRTANNSFEDLDIENFNRILNVNVTGQVICTKIIGSLMKDNSIKGSIVNVSSIYGKVSPKQEIYDHIKTPSGSYKKPIVYSISKSALTNFTKYLATYWGEQEIRINTVVLGGIVNEQDEDFIKKYIENVPLGRMASVEECILPILFLLSNESSYITGSELVVDGGWTSW
jgi:NAD(P)-dependent dehydrogenase (short-subunit alcohol dehydrogenase family)